MASVETTRQVGERLQSIKSVVEAGTTGNYVLITRFPCSLRLAPAGGASGSVQYSLSHEEDIRAGSAVWDSWARGTVAASATDIPEGPITGVRGVSASGIVTLEVVQ